MGQTPESPRGVSGLRESPDRGEPIGSPSAPEREQGQEHSEADRAHDRADEQPGRLVLEPHAPRPRGHVDAAEGDVGGHDLGRGAIDPRPPAAREASRTTSQPGPGASTATSKASRPMGDSSRALPRSDTSERHESASPVSSTTSRRGSNAGATTSAAASRTSSPSARDRRARPRAAPPRSGGRSSAGPSHDRARPGANWSPSRDDQSSALRAGSPAA